MISKKFFIALIFLSVLIVSPVSVKAQSFTNNGQLIQLLQSLVQKLQQQLQQLLAVQQTQIVPNQLNKTIIFPIQIGVAGVDPNGWNLKFIYPSDWQVSDSRLSNKKINFTPPSAWGTVGSIIIEWRDVKTGCPSTNCFMRGHYPLVYTQSFDPRVLQVFNQFVKNITYHDPSSQEVTRVGYIPYENLGRTFDEDDFALFDLLARETFASATTWFGGDVKVTINIDPEDSQNRVMLMKTKSATSFFKDIDWPRGASTITFDYLFPRPYTEGNLHVYLYDFKTGQPTGEERIVYYDFISKGRVVNPTWETATVYVGEYAGKNARLNFVLRSEDGQETSLLLDNLNTFGFVN